MNHCDSKWMFFHYYDSLYNTANKGSSFNLYMGVMIIDPHQLMFRCDTEVKQYTLIFNFNDMIPLQARQLHHEKFLAR